MMHNLRRIDLNLLLTLEALLTEQHVSRAALRLYRSQPAVSHALAHLRLIFEDPLLVRAGGRMVLTPKASALRQPLREALGQLDAILTTPAFDPATAIRQYRLALSDYAADLLLPALIPFLRAEAKGIDLLITQTSREGMMAGLMEGALDLAIGVFPESPREIMQEVLFEERFMSFTDQQNMPAMGEMTLADWLALPHVLVAVRADAANEIDLALAAVDLHRHISVVLPHWSVAPKLLPGTDLVLTIASKTVMSQALSESLVAFAPPIALPTFTLAQAWHNRVMNDPAHQWLRTQIKAHLGMV